MSNIQERQERFDLLSVLWNRMNENWSQSAFCGQINETLPLKTENVHWGCATDVGD